MRTSPIFRTFPQIYREFGNELNMLKTIIKSIVDNQSLNNKNFNVGNISYVKKRIENATNFNIESSDVIPGGHVYTEEYVRRKQSDYVALLVGILNNSRE